MSLRAEKPGDLKPQGYVNDFAGVLNTKTKNRLSLLCAEVDSKTHAQIAVVTIHTLGGLPIEDFSIDLAQRWGVGYKGNDRGALILLALAERRYRIEVGYGLEPILPDGKVGGFGRMVVPLLRSGNYNGALLRLTELIAGAVAKDRGVTLTHVSAEGAQPAQETKPAASNGNFPLSGLLFFLMILIGIMLFARRAMYFGPGMGGWWLGGGGGSSWGGGSFGGGGGFGGFGGGSFGGGGASGGW